MKLIRLDLENFRQYYGKQSINFAHDEKENVTILFGENGKGKTGIYRAIMFVLFGSQKISQDAGNDKIYLTNLKFLDESPTSTGSAKVTLTFEHENILYEIKREIGALKHSKGIITEQEKEVFLTETDTITGNIKPKLLKDRQEIYHKVNKIMNEEIKDFFLFDAEKIDTLAKSDNAVKKEVKAAIFNLLQIDKIKLARKIINDQAKSLKSNITKNMEDGNVTEVSNRINDIEAEIEDIDEQNNKLQEDIILIEESISNHNLTLDKNKNIIEKRNRIKDKENNIKYFQEQVNNIESQLFKNTYMNMPYLLGRNIFDANKIFLEEFIGDNKINIPLNILNESLLENQCLVCHNDLNNDEKSRNYIEMLQKEQNNSETYNLARNLLNVIEEKENYYKSSEEELVNTLKTYKQLIEKLDQENNYINELKRDIAEQAKNSVDLADIQKMIDQDETRKIDLNVQLTMNTNSLEKLEKELEQKKSEYQERIQKQNKSGNDRAQLDLLYKLEKVLKEIADTFSTDVRNLLGEYTTDIFKKLIDTKDIKVIDHVEIDKNFEIGAINNNGYKITQNISQGQRQILSLSFITALARLAVREDSEEKIDFPLFMDSPFNRLSGMNRDNLIEKIPELTGQWILLVTDTELTDSEERVFKNTGKLGSWYRINQIDVEHSEIKFVPLDEKMSTRGGL